MYITQANTQDVNEICKIDEGVIGNNSRRDYLTRAILNGNCLVAKRNETINGFIIYDTTFYSNTFIWLLIVSPLFRRQGVATALIQHVEVICPTEKLFTSTNDSNTVMRCLCDSLGFVRSGWIYNLDEDDPEIIYFKRIRKTD